MATRTTRWIWTERPVWEDARSASCACGMAEFWAFMGKARGFTVGLHSKDSLEILGQDAKGDSTVYLLDSSPVYQDHRRSD